MKILRSMSTVWSFTLGSRIFGFLRETLVAAILGAGVITDALFIAIKIPSIFRRVFAEGALNAAFIPIFTRLYTQEGAQKAKEFAEEVLSLLFFFMLGFVVLFELILPVFLPLIAPGLHATPERLMYAIQFSRITFPFILFISLCALYSGILNSLERFVAVSSSPMMGNIFIIGFILALKPLVTEKGYLCATSILGCGIIQLLWVMIPAYKTPFRLRLRMPRFTEHLKKMLKLMGPVAVTSGLHQINVGVGIFISSFLPVGGISYLNYAERVNQLPTSMIGTALATVMLPLLARLIRSRQGEETTQTQNQALELALLLALPSMAVLFCFAEPIIIVLFKTGAFALKDARQTSYALMAFSLGLPAYILIKLFSTIFYAHEEAKTLIVYALISVITDIILALALLKPFHHMGIASATAIAAWVYALGLGSKLYRKNYFSLTPHFLSFFPRILLTTFTLAIIMFYMKEYAYPYFLMSKPYQIGALCLLIMSSLVFYGILGSLLGAIDLTYWKNQFNRGV